MKYILTQEEYDALNNKNANVLYFEKKGYAEGRKNALDLVHKVISNPEEALECLRFGKNTTQEERELFCKLVQLVKGK